MLCSWTTFATSRGCQTPTSVSFAGRGAMRRVQSHHNCNQGSCCDHAGTSTESSGRGQLKKSSLLRLGRHALSYVFTQLWSLAVTHEAEKVQEEVDDVQVNVQGSEDVVVDRELVLLVTATNDQLGVVDNVEAH